MVFRASMLETDFAGRLPQGTFCLHSRWEGYLEQPEALEVKKAIENAHGQVIRAHVSGHLRQDDIVALIKQSKPHAIVPIHTFSPQLLSDQFTNVRLLVDGESFDIL